MAYPIRLNARIVDEDVDASGPTPRAPRAPCGMMDRMGLGVVHHVAKLLAEADPKARAYVRHLEENFIETGRLGVASGQGFYRYPNPSFAQPGFI